TNTPCMICESAARKNRYRDLPLPKFVARIAFKTAITVTPTSPNTAGVRHTAMLTGDSRATGEKVAKELGLDSVYAELLPQQKVEQMEALSKQTEKGGKLVFVGDGINDAPVLARADVGVAMGGLGSDAAIEAADVVLMTDEPSKLADAIRIAKRTRSIVRQNIIFALGVKIAILILAAFGIATMWAAVFGDVGVTVIAVLNAIRATNLGSGKSR
ncbi:MAG TPA: HAD-IC family P-type ATPase, partial [Caproiciproducens sp.]|nr:HAD-IC family P-type ATPase [Caproiciproducens sp.]